MSFDSTRISGLSRRHSSRPPGGSTSGEGPASRFRTRRDALVACGANKVPSLLSPAKSVTPVTFPPGCAKLAMRLCVPCPIGLLCIRYITRIHCALCDRMSLFRRDLSPSALTMDCGVLHTDRPDHLL